MARSDLDVLIGRLIAQKFLIEAPIGAGAMGAVFRARQVALEKTVAIKVLHGEHAGDPTFAARFHREAKAASRLNHPNSVQVIDFGAEPDGLLYIAMEFLDGRSLHRVIKDDGPLPARRIADILMQALAAVNVAHEMGVVHRDLKPDNVMVLSGTDDDGRPRDTVKVCDFGIAKISDARAYRDGGSGDAGHRSDAPVTTAGLMVGTPEYMSPEQGRGEKLDARSDLYSMGVILYEMLTGRVPFETENAIGTVLKHISEMPRPPSEVAAGVDTRLEAVCMRAMRKGRDERYQTAREMRVDLRAVAEGQAPASEPQVSGPAIQIGRASRASVSAATLAVPTPAAGPAAVAELVPKATFEGAAASIPGKRNTGRTVVVAAIATALGLVATVGVLSIRRGSPTASASEVASSETVDPIAPAPFTEIAPLSPVDSPKAAATPQAPAKAAAAAAAHGLKTASPVATPTAPAPAPAPAPVPAPTPAPTPTPIITPPADIPDPTFDPNSGYVEVGIINGMGVRDRAVRGALHGSGIANCYRAALRARNARVTGVAMLNLSFDEGGVVRSAILTDGEFLPGLTRCAQGAAAALHVAAAAVDSGGGTAEAVIAFKVR